MSRTFFQVFGSLLVFVASFLTACSQDVHFAGGSQISRVKPQSVEGLGDANTNQSLQKTSPIDFSLDLQYSDTSDPLKLVLIVDDSSSMVPKQQQLAKGLDIALDTVKGKNVSVYLYSSSTFGLGYKFFDTNYLNNYRMTQFPMPTPANEPKIYASWGGMHYADILSKTAKPSLDVLPRVKKNGTWVDPASSLIDFIPEEAETKFVINRSAFNTPDGTLKFTDSMTAEQFAAMKSKLKQEIIIGDRGNSEEMPLCTLAALLQNDGPNKIFRKGDRVAFVIISDEDQTKTLRPCPYAHRVTSVVANPGPKAAAMALAAAVIMDYQTKCDSTANDGYCGQQPWIQRHHTACKNNPLCQNLTQGNLMPCNAELRADYLQFFRKTYAKEIASGKYRLSDTDTCQVSFSRSHHATAGSAVGVTWANPDPRPFEFSGKSYASIPAYFETILPNEIFTGDIQVWGNYGSPTGDFVNMDGISKAEDLPGVLRKMASDFFGQPNYTISVIGNTGASSNSGCNVDPAAESKILFNTADTKSSVCDDDYSKGLSWLLGFGFKKIKPTYNMPPQFVNDEYELFIALGGRESPLTPDQYSYDEVTQILTLKGNISFAQNARILVRQK